MKKIFALALAALMTAGMTTVAFADKGDVKFRNDSNDVYAMLDTNDDGAFDADENANDGVNDFVTSKDGVLSLGEVAGELKVAIPLYTKAGNPITDKEAIKGWKIKDEWKVGDLAEKPDFEFVKINGVYQYAVTFTTPVAEDTKSVDLAGSIIIYDKSGDMREPTMAVNKVEIGTEYGYGEHELDWYADLADAEIVIFKDNGVKIEGEETLTFGDYFEFDVDVTGQGKLNLKNNQDFNKEFAAMYDYANIDFITFEKEPTFNKIGTAYIYADEDAFVYEVTADGAKEIKGLKWDEDYEAWSFKTRTLKSYAISDVELTEKTVTEDKDDASSTTDGGKENPDTGR